MSAPAVADWVLHSDAEGLSEAERAMLDALMGRLMPGDAARGLPNAHETGAAAFVSRLLGREPPVYVEVKDWRELYPKALAALDAVARTRGGSGLAESSPDTVEAILRDLQAGTLAGLPQDFNQALLFKTLLRHCYQGCFSDPRWGGNRGAGMWRAIGYPLRPAEG